MSRILGLNTGTASLKLDVSKLKCDVDMLVSKISSCSIDELLRDCISSYIKKGLTLAEIIHLEAPTNKCLQLEITKAYGDFVISNLPDIPINQDAIITSAIDDFDESMIKDAIDWNMDCNMNYDCNWDENAIADTLDIDSNKRQLATLTSEQIEFRNTTQIKYISSSLELLSDSTSSRRVLLKAPTGFGKTVILYKLIDQIGCNITVIFTPRRQLNNQTIEDKYKQHLANPEEWEFHNFSPDNNTTAQSKKTALETFITKNMKNSKNNKKNTKMIILACYQSSAKLLKQFDKLKLPIDLCICDEAHIINSWSYLSNTAQRRFLCNDSIQRYIFATATPAYNMISRPEIWGTLVEHVQIYELINKGLLCPFEVLVKSCSHKNKVIDVAKIVMKTMRKYYKRKGIVYCSNITNALAVYALFKLKYPDENIFIYVSDRRISQKTFDNFPDHPEFKNVVWNSTDASIHEFNKCKAPAIVITVRMLGYGYDNVDIDLLAFADGRDGEAEIRQILGRGLRNIPELYPNKVLHVIMPITKERLLDEMEDGEKVRLIEYRNLKRFLEFIVSECGKDIINGRIVSRQENQNKVDEENESSSSELDSIDEEGDLDVKKKKLGKYDGDEIPLEICRELSTNLYGTYSRFLGFLRLKHVFDEASYNQMREDEGSSDWIPVLGEVRKKFKKFCFLDIKAPENKVYYQTWEECEEAYDTIKNELIEELGGKMKVKKLLKSVFNDKLNEKIQKTDTRIPANISLFYYNENQELE